jgi:HEAT repeat protein
MTGSVYSQINHTNDCTDEEANYDVLALIKQLTGKDDYSRMRARELLICIGKPVVDELVKSLPNADTSLRWQIIKIFECIQDPASAPVLVEQLKDDDAGVRWAASDALIALRTDAIPALLQALVTDFDSSWLRHGAHHILRVMKDSGRLNKAELDVYAALEDIEPMVVVPWAAEKAIESLRINK